MQQANTVEFISAGNYFVKHKSGRKGFIKKFDYGWVVTFDNFNYSDPEHYLKDAKKTALNWHFEKEEQTEKIKQEEKTKQQVEELKQEEAPKKQHGGKRPGAGRKKDPGAKLTKANSKVCRVSLRDMALIKSGKQDEMLALLNDWRQQAQEASKTSPRWEKMKEFFLELDEILCNDFAPWDKL